MDIKTRSKWCLSYFTLLELLIVIAIIAILASLLMPALQKAKEKSRQITCAGNLKQMGQALYLYVDDYKGNITIGAATGADCYASMLGPYLNVTKKIGIGWVNCSNIYHCPSDSIYTYDYGQNAWSGYTNASRKFRNISEFKNPSSIINITEAQDIVAFTDISLFDPRHGALGNAVFIDAHVEGKKLLSPSDLKE